MIESVFETLFDSASVNEELFAPASDEELDARRLDLYKLVDRFKKELEHRPDHDAVKSAVISKYVHRHGHDVPWRRMYDYFFNKREYAKQGQGHRWRDRAYLPFIDGYKRWESSRKLAESLFAPASDEELILREEETFKLWLQFEQDLARAGDLWRSVIESYEDTYETSNINWTSLYWAFINRPYGALKDRVARYDRWKKKQTNESLFAPLSTDEAAERGVDLRTVLWGYTPRALVIRKNVDEYYWRTPPAHGEKIKDIIQHYTELRKADEEKAWEYLLTATSVAFVSLSEPGPDPHDGLVKLDIPKNGKLNEELFAPLSKEDKNRRNAPLYAAVHELADKIEATATKILGEESRPRPYREGHDMLQLVEDMMKLLADLCSANVISVDAFSASRGTSPRYHSEVEQYAEQAIRFAKFIKQYIRP